MPAAAELCTDMLGRVPFLSFQLAAAKGCAWPGRSQGLPLLPSRKPSFTLTLVRARHAADEASCFGFEVGMHRDEHGNRSIGTGLDSAYGFCMRLRICLLLGVHSQADLMDAVPRQLDTKLGSRYLPHSRLCSCAGPSIFPSPAGTTCWMWPEAC